MVYGKRECPFALQDDHQTIYSKNPQKRICIRPEELFPHQGQELMQSVVEGGNVMDMECQTCTTVEQSQHDNTQTCPENQEMSSIINNNNDSSSVTTPSVCSRCQAGQSGHASHIGR